MTRSYENGTLLDGVTGWLDGYVYRPTGATRRMVKIANDVPVWEEILAEQGRSLSPYVGPRRRAVLHDLIARIDRDTAASRLRAQAGGADG